MKRMERPEFPPHRADNAHKGDCGRALIIAGSRGMSGAAALCGMGALRGGAGLVTVATTASSAPIVAGFDPSYMTVGLPEDGCGYLGEAAESMIFSLAEATDVVAMGPGCGQSPAVSQLLVQCALELPQPAVVDADGLNALARMPSALMSPQESRGPRVFTPHPGEFSRLTGVAASVIQHDREGIAAEYARRWNVVLLLKGPRTIVTDGKHMYVNTTGNSGMATGGMGDVLTGLITALMGQQLSPLDAAAFGAYLHGLAGDIAASERSKPGLIASDMPLFLAEAWQSLGY